MPRLRAPLFRAVAVALAVTACGGQAEGPPARGPVDPPPARAPGPAASSQPPSDRAGVLGAEASPITFERMARYPEPGWQVPRKIAYSPDGKLVTYLQSESGSEQM